MSNTFGSTPKCNGNAVLVIFQPFPALPIGRIVGSIVTVAMILPYTWVLVRDPMPTSLKRKPNASTLTTYIPAPVAKPHLPKKQEEVELEYATAYMNVDHARRSSTDTLNIDWRMLIRMMAVAVIWIISIVNTELLIKKSHFEPDSDSRSNWQFGQVRVDLCMKGIRVLTWVDRCCHCS
ncbi:hypothetical protein FRB91_007663 [Serendipita sp. 411]|nr:hypothetical protein FRB91_007663 [Serendipita sp. 411]